jgi:hypothetical protein
VRGMKRICEASMPLERRIAMIAIAGAICLGLWIVSTVPPANLPMERCVFHSITGYSCLTCGMTRSLHAIACGNLSASIRYHLFGPVVFMGMLVCFAAVSAEAFSGKKVISKFRWKTWKPVFAILTFAWFAYWAIRLAAE